MREFRNIESFLAFAAKLAVETRIAGNLGLRDGGRVIMREARDEIGKYQGAAGPFAPWKELAAMTKAERVELGFSENEPLLRTGGLRDSIGLTAGDGHAEVGSDSDIAVDQELGTRRIPPRSFLGGAAVRKEAEVVDIMAGAVVNVLAGRLRRNHTF